MGGSTVVSVQQRYTVLTSGLKASSFTVSVENNDKDVTSSFVHVILGNPRRGQAGLRGARQGRLLALIIERLT
jgi:hypothetical protein